MKKIFSTVLAAALVLSLAACGGSGAGNSGSGNGNSGTSVNSGTSAASGTQAGNAASTDTKGANVMEKGKLYQVGDNEVIKGLRICGNQSGTAEFNTRDAAKDGIRCIFQLNEWAEFYMDSDKGSGITVWVIEHDDDAVYDDKTGFSDEMKGFVLSCDLTDPGDGESQWGAFYIHPDEHPAGNYDLVFTLNGKAVAKMLTVFYKENELTEKSDAELEALMK